jgi:ankyrin repeat protein
MPPSRSTILVLSLVACARTPARPDLATAPAQPAPAVRTDEPTAASAQTTAAVTPEERDRFLETVKTGELAEVQRALGRTPALAAARSTTGRTAVVLALGRSPGEGKGDFYLPAENPFLQAVLAARPALDAFETAAVGDAGALARLLAADPGLVSRVHLGWTLLHFAAFGGNTAAVRVLLDHGAALEKPAENKFANTPLLVALLTGDRATVQLLLERGANLGARYEGGTTALHLAAELGRVDLLALLLGRGAALNARTDDGATPLAIAVRLNRTAAAELLRSRGGEM